MPFPDSSHIIDVNNLMKNTLSRHVLVKFLQVATAVYGLILQCRLHLHRSTVGIIVAPSTFVAPIIVSGVLLVSHVAGCWPDRRVVMMYNVSIAIMYGLTLNTFMAELSPADQQDSQVWNNTILKSIVSAVGLLLEIMEFILELVIINLEKITPIDYSRR